MENYTFRYETLFCTANSVSAFVCLTAAVLVFTLKLHAKVVYRMALYQVLASLAFATTEASQIVFSHSKKGTRDSLCAAIGWLVVYTQSTKLLFTMWMTLHLFCFAVFYKNLKRFEVLYVGTSLLVPAAMSSVPLVTQSYGLNASGRCYILLPNETRYIATIERLALWDGPAAIILLMASTAVVVMVASLSRRVCLKLQYEPIGRGGQFRTALIQLLPLTAYPVLFFILPVFTSDAYLLTSSSSWPSKPLALSDRIFLSLWSAASGATLLAHIFVARCVARKRAHANARAPA